MGNRKSGWGKGVFLVFLVVIFLFLGILINHFFRANAIANEPINQQNSEHSNPPLTRNQTVMTILPSANDHQLENEWMDKHRNQKVLLNRQMTNQQNDHVPENKQTQATVPLPANDSAVEQAPIKVQPTEQTNSQPVDSPRKTVYLTFDDGPMAFSNEIIALLELHHFKATFFMIDGNIKKYPDAVKQMIQTGESVGLHGVTHNKTSFYASEDSVLGELNQTRTTLKDITGIDSFLMRTPYGSYPYMTNEYKKAVADHGYLMWDWNIDSRDWYYEDDRYVSNVIEQMVKKSTQDRPIVILLHEKRETLVYLPKLLDYLSIQNYECKAIDSSIPPIHF